MAKRGDKRPAVAFIKKEEIQNKQFYIVVSCGKEACQYTFKVEGSNKCKIEDGTVYSYGSVTISESKSNLCTYSSNGVMSCYDSCVLNGTCK